MLLRAPLLQLVLELARLSPLVLTAPQGAPTPGEEPLALHRV